MCLLCCMCSTIPWCVLCYYSRQARCALLWGLKYEALPACPYGTLVTLAYSRLVAFQLAVLCCAGRQPGLCILRAFWPRAHCGDTCLYHQDACSPWSTPATLQATWRRQQWRWRLAAVTALRPAAVAVRMLLLLLCWQATARLGLKNVTTPSKAWEEVGPLCNVPPHPITMLVGPLTSSNAIVSSVAAARMTPEAAVWVRLRQ
jgi:hypothetical protein